MNGKPLHLLKSNHGLHRVQFCNGRATMNFLSFVDAPEQVTCKACLKRMAKEGMLAADPVPEGVTVH